MTTQAQGVLDVRSRGHARAAAAEDWRWVVVPLMAFGSVAVVVVDSPLGVVGRVVGVGLTLMGAIGAVRLVREAPGWRAMGQPSSDASPPASLRRVGTFLDRVLLVDRRGHSSASP